MDRDVMAIVSDGFGRPQIVRRPPPIQSIDYDGPQISPEYYDRMVEQMARQASAGLDIASMGSYSTAAVAMRRQDEYKRILDGISLEHFGVKKTKKRLHIERVKANG